MQARPTSRSVETRLSGFWALLLALCLNPWVVGHLLTSDGRLESRAVTLALSALTGLLVLLGVLSITQIIRLTGALSKIFLLLSSALIAFYLTIFVDRLIGKLFLSPAQSLIFPANSAVKYITPEFNFTARINSLGFRDGEYPLHKGNKFRIVVIGDSFTFGWGVNIQDTWVKQLEKKLLKEYADIEVLNLGRSGASPETYAAIAARVVPVLQPDLVIIALLQGNDLQQLLPTDAPETISAPPQRINFRRILNIATANAYPNILRLLAATALQTEVKPIWQEQAAFITQHLTPAQKLRFEKMDANAKELFINGELNPDLVYSFLKDPNLYLHLQHTRSLGVQAAKKRLARHLKNIQRITDRHHARLLTITVPNKYYLCEKTMREHTAFGAAVAPEIITRNTPDSLVAAATNTLGVPFYSTTATMQSYCPAQRLYYTYDSHFTPLGNKLFADAIFAALKEPFKAIRSKRKQENGNE